MIHDQEKHLKGLGPHQFLQIGQEKEKICMWKDKFSKASKKLLLYFTNQKV